jgi:hypothetical protein
MINSRSGHGYGTGLWLIPVAFICLIIGWPVMIPYLWLLNFVDFGLKLTDNELGLVLITLGLIGFYVQTKLFGSIYNYFSPFY